MASGDHESKYRAEVIGLGRQDWFLEPQSCFRSAHLIFVAPLVSTSCPPQTDAASARDLTSRFTPRAGAALIERRG
jgi:hypothetical protein